MVSVSIKRDHHGNLSEVKMNLPVYTRPNVDKTETIVNVPFLGIELHVSPDLDVLECTSSAITCYVILAEQEGMGLEREIQAAFISEKNKPYLD